MSAMNIWTAFGVGIILGMFICFLIVLASPRTLTRVGKCDIVVDCNGNYYRLKPTKYFFRMHEFQGKPLEGYTTSEQL